MAFEWAWEKLFRLKKKIVYGVDWIRAHAIGGPLYWSASYAKAKETPQNDGNHSVFP